MDIIVQQNITQFEVIAEIANDEYANFNVTVSPFINEFLIEVEQNITNFTIISEPILNDFIVEVYQEVTNHIIEVQQGSNQNISSNSYFPSGW